MSAQKQISMVPEVDAQYLIANIERSLAQLKVLAEHQAIISVPTEKWLTRSEAAEHCKYGLRTFDSMYAEGYITGHRVTPTSEPRFLASELNEDLKKSRKASKPALR